MLARPPDVCCEGQIGIRRLPTRLPFLTQLRHWLGIAVGPPVAGFRPYQALIGADRMPSPELGASMRRRKFIGLLGGATIWPIAVRAQQPTQLRRIGTLLTGNDPQFGDAFVEALETIGWIEGRNVHIDRRFHMGDPERMRTYATELVKLSPDVILAATPVEATILRQETRIIPIVFAAGVDPVSQGIVDSFAHPGGNVTGCSSFEFSLGGKWI